MGSSIGGGSVDEGGAVGEIGKLHEVSRRARSKIEVEKKRAANVFFMMISLLVHNGAKMDRYTRCCDDRNVVGLQIYCTRFPLF